jgi:DNA-directed RNA polymerase subunit RPC12/RpoP
MSAPVMNYPCQACGASVEYAAGAMVLRCPYCGHEQQVAAPQRQIREHAYAALPPKRLAVDGLVGQHVLVCQKCGAKTETDNLSQRCGFCDAPLVADPNALDQIAPEAVLPFRLDHGAARGALRDWVHSRRFAPNNLKKVTDAEKLHGTYLPHWTFDAQTYSAYTGERGTYYYVTETYTVTNNGQSETRTRQVRKTRWTPTSGQVQRHFDDVLVPATQHLTEKQLDKLHPWPLEQATAFQRDFLSGFETLRYDIEPDTGLANAKARMAPVIQSDCRGDIGGDEQRVHSVNTNYQDVTYKLMLLPVWIAAYIYAGKPFQVLVNAHTAEVIGERPYSVAKIVSAILAALLVIAAIVTVYMLLKN